MHRDQKIGLSLAVLLIGFAGAFCFRHEPVAHLQSIALDHADEIDLRIEHLPIRAYTEKEGVSLPGASSIKERDVAVEGSLSDILMAPLPLAAEDLDHIDLFAGPPEPLRVYSPPPPLVRRRTISPPAVQIPQPSGHSSKPPPLASPTPSADQRAANVENLELDRDSAPMESATAMTTYVVQPGDTLSGIAQRYLGSMVRYQELFEANRDVLANPNSLRAGVVLRIPADTSHDDSH